LRVFLNGNAIHYRTVFRALKKEKLGEGKERKEEDQGYKRIIEI
jgi:hypothetical protein